MNDSSPEYARFVDSGEIADDDLILRVVPADKYRLTLERGLDVQSNAFEDRPAQVAMEQYNMPGACMSVAIERLWLAASATWESLLAGFNDDAIVVSMPAGEIRNLVTGAGLSVPQGIMLSPTDSQPWHAVVWDETLRARAKAAKRALAAACSQYHRR